MGAPKMIEIDGVTKSLNKWAKEYGHKHSTVYNRLEVGWDIKKALETPVNQSYQVNSSGGKISKSEAQIHLNDLPFEGLPAPFQKLVTEYDYKGKKFGMFLYRFYPKQFDNWFRDYYVPAQKAIYDKHTRQHQQAVGSVGTDSASSGNPGPKPEPIGHAGDKLLRVEDRAKPLVAMPNP